MYTHPVVKNMDPLIIIFSILASGGLWLRYLYKYDKAEPEPLWTVIRIGLWGGFLSTTIAGILNSSFAEANGIDLTVDILPPEQGILFSTFVGFNEEFIKALTTVFLVRNLKEMDEPIDAIIYATAIGLGFAVIENFSYSLEHGLVNLIVRSFTAVPLHIGLAAVWGYKIAEAKFINKAPYISTMFTAIVFASVIHAIYDAILFTVDMPLLTLAISLAIAIVLIKYVKRKLIFLLEQSPFIRSGMCIHCGTLNSPQASYCHNCSRQMKQIFYKICDACFHKNPVYASECEKCQEQLENNNHFLDI